MPTTLRAGSAIGTTANRTATVAVVPGAPGVSWSSGVVNIFAAAAPLIRNTGGCAARAAGLSSSTVRGRRRNASTCGARLSRATSATAAAPGTPGAARSGRSPSPLPCTRNTTNFPLACSGAISADESPTSPPNTIASDWLSSGRGPSATKSVNAARGAPATANVDVVSNVRVLSGIVWKYVPPSPAGTRPARLISAAM